MKLTPLLGNSQKLDGGAMFGNVPKALWSQWIKPDEENRITLACRALLIQHKGQNILLETGIGAFFSPKLKERYGVVENEHVLLNSLKSHGLTHEDIHVVVLSHLHFDHAGGLLSSWEGENIPSRLLFPNAQFMVGEEAWERAMNPHYRDKASFIPALQPLLEKSGRLHLQSGKSSPLLGPDFSFHFSNGHTPGLMMTEIQTEEGPMVFASDLIPGRAWVHLPVTMGYDRAPELLIDEKEKLLNYLLSKKGQLFYTHDAQFAFSHIEKNEKGQYAAVNPAS